MRGKSYGHLVERDNVQLHIQVRRGKKGPPSGRALGVKEVIILCGNEKFAKRGAGRPPAALKFQSAEKWSWRASRHSRVMHLRYEKGHKLRESSPRTKSSPRLRVFLGFQGVSGKIVADIFTHRSPTVISRYGRAQF